MVTQQQPSTHGVDEDDSASPPNTSIPPNVRYMPLISPTSMSGSPRPATAYTRRSANTSPSTLQADHDGQPPRATKVAAVRPAAGVANHSKLVDVALLSGCCPPQRSLVTRQLPIRRLPSRLGMCLVPAPV
jgi:hypothetical protein